MSKLEKALQLQQTLPADYYINVILSICHILVGSIGICTSILVASITPVYSIVMLIMGIINVHFFQRHMDGIEHTLTLSKDVERHILSLRETRLNSIEARLDAYISAHDNENVL